MDQTKIGAFIASCRREKDLTQAQLAQMLGITDRAVSKWETGKSMPDASIMLALCEILGIRVNELLSGERIAVQQFEQRAAENLMALKAREETRRKSTVLPAVLFSGALLTGATVCFICDLAVSGALTWSLIPAASIAFAWLVVFPGLCGARHGFLFSLLSLSIFVFPYLYLLKVILNAPGVFAIGSVMAALGLAFLWTVVFVFLRIGKGRRLLAAGVCFLLPVPLLFGVNATLAKMLSEPLFDVWDAFTVFLLVLCAAGCFMGDHRRKE